MEISERKVHSVEFALYYDAEEDEFNEVEIFKSIIKKCKDKSSKIGFKRMFDPSEIQMIDGLYDVFYKDKDSNTNEES